MGRRVNVITKDTNARNEKPLSKKYRMDFSSVSDTPAGYLLDLQRTAGNQAVQILLKTGTIEARLKISQPNDIYE